KFSGFNLSSKKAAKKSDNKSTTKKASLESTRRTELSESFYDKVDSLEIGPIRVSSDEETTNQEDVPEVDINKPVDDDSLASD
ncbi:10615_t:CDS:2, partial [Gigaspora rosea]